MNPILRMAILGGSVSSVQLILKTPINLEARDSKGRTALLYAASLGNREVCLALLEKGASPRALDNEGDDARIVAIRHGHKEAASAIANFVAMNAANGSKASIVSVPPAPSEALPQNAISAATSAEIHINLGGVPTAPMVSDHAQDLSTAARDMPALLPSDDAVELAETGDPRQLQRIVDAHMTTSSVGLHSRSETVVERIQGDATFTAGWHEEEISVIPASPAGAVARFENECQELPVDEGLEMNFANAYIATDEQLFETNSEVSADEDWNVDDEDWVFEGDWSVDATAEERGEDNTQLRQRLVLAQTDLAQFVPASVGAGWEDVEIELPEGLVADDEPCIASSDFFDGLRGLVRSGLEFGAIAYAELAGFVEEAWDNQSELQTIEGGVSYLLDSVLSAISMAGVRVDHSPLAPWSWFLENDETLLNDDDWQRTEVALNFLRQSIEAPGNSGNPIYAREIRRHGKMRRHEEASVALEVQRAGWRRKDTIRRLIGSNLSVVLSLAERMAGEQLSLDDCVQEGALGLVRAVEKFEPGSARLSTYAAWWVRQRIARAHADQARLIRLPVHFVETLRNMHRTASRLGASNHGEVAEHALASELGLSVARLQELKRIELLPLSLDQTPPDEFFGTSWEEIIVDPSPPVEDIVYLNLLSSGVQELLSRLSERENIVIRKRVGLFDGKAHTLEEIGQTLGVTRERVRQIEKKVLKKLGNPTFLNSLRKLIFN